MNVCATVAVATSDNHDSQTNGGEHSIFRNGYTPLALFLRSAVCINPSDTILF